MDLVGGRTGAGYQEIQTDLQSGRESAIMDIVSRVSWIEYRIFDEHCLVLEN